MSSINEAFLVLGGAAVLGQSVSSERDAIHLIKSGLPGQSGKEVMRRLDLPLAEFARITMIPERTLKRRVSDEDGQFTPMESRSLFEVARVTSEAEAVFGSPDKAREWLKRPNRSLDGDRPLDLLDTEIGQERVSEILGRIAHGVFG